MKGRLPALDGLRGLAILMVTGLAVVAYARALIYGPPMPRGVRVVAIGNSILAGFHQRPDWPDFLPRGVHLTNIAQSGYEASQILSAQPRPPGNHDVVLISLGTNEAYRGRSLAAYSYHLRTILRAGYARHVLLLGPPHDLRYEREGRYDRLLVFRQVMQRIAAEEGADWVDLSAVIPAEARYYDALGVHPNRAGSELMGRAIGRAVAAIMIGELMSHP